MHCWVVLRHDGSVCSDWHLCCRDLFRCLGFGLFVLSGWHFRLVGWIECMQFLLRRVVLRHDRSVCIHRHLCCRDLLCSVGDRLLILSGRNFRRNCWTECMLRLLRRIILRHGGALGSDRQLRRW